MTVSVDVAGRFLQTLVLLVLFSFVCKIPDVDVIGGGAAELDGAVFTEQIEGFLQIFRVNVGGSFDGGNCAVF